MISEVDREAGQLLLHGEAAARFIEAPVKIAAERLELRGGPSPVDVERSVKSIALPRSSKLKHLTLRDWPDLATLSVESRIKQLTISGCPSLSKIEPLPSLTEFSVSGCSLALLSGSLNKVTSIHRCTIEAEWVHVLAELDKLTYLVVHTDLLDLGFLAPLEKLRALKIRGHFETLDGVQTLSKLADLDARSPALSDISALAALPRLRQVEFVGCKSLSDISVFEGRKLRMIDLTGTKVRAKGIPDSLLPSRSRSPVYPPPLLKRALEAQKKAKAAAKRAKAAAKKTKSSS